MDWKLVAVWIEAQKQVTRQSGLGRRLQSGHKVRAPPRWKRTRTTTLAPSGKACLGECICLARAVSSLLPPLESSRVSGGRAPPCPSPISSSELQRAPPPWPGPSSLPPRRALFQHRGQRSRTWGGWAGPGGEEAGSEGRDGLSPGRHRVSRCPTHIPHTLTTGNRPLFTLLSEDNNLGGWNSGCHIPPAQFLSQKRFLSAIPTPLHPAPAPLSPSLNLQSPRGQ